MQPLEVAMHDAETRMTASFERPDFGEGVHSFLEQRPPQFPRLGRDRSAPARCVPIG